jgi:AcrR family transcriptional regulator
MAAGTKKRKSGAGEKRIDVERQAVEAAMALTALQGWNDTTLADIAGEAGISLSDLRAHFTGKRDILAAFNRMIDRAVLEGTDADIANEPVKDRLFDVLIRRLDALMPYRDALAALQHDLQRDPPALACYLAGPVRRSMEWMLDAAQVPGWGPFSHLQVKGLMVVYATVLRVWLRDEGEDLSQTMAALDKALGRADSLVGILRRGPRRHGNGVEAAEAPEV